MPVGLESYCFDQPRVDTGELSAFHHRPSRDFKKVQHLPHPESVTPPPDLENDDCALVGRPSLLLEEEVPVEHGEQGAPHIHQPLDLFRHTGNSGGRKAGEDLTHDPCRGRADHLTDSKDDGVKRGGVSHLY